MPDICSNAAYTPPNAIIIKPSVVVLTLWALVCLLLNYKLGESLYLSNLLMLALIVWWYAKTAISMQQNRLLGAALVTIVVLGLVGWAYAAGNPADVRFQPELSKQVLLILGAYALKDLIHSRQIRSLAIVIPPAVVGFAIFTYLFGTWNYYGPGERFGIEALGSPNTTAYVAVFSLLLHIYKGRFHRAVSSQRRKTHLQVWDWTVAVSLLAVIIATQSRGGLLTAIVGLAMMTPWTWRMLSLGVGALVTLIVAAVLALGYWALIPTAAISYGRLRIWNTLVDNINQSSSVILGMGPGAVNFHSWYTASVQSAHSVFIGVFYSYGGVGLVLFSIWLVWLWKRASAPSTDSHLRRLKRAVWATLVVGFLVDSYLFTGQLVWFSALLLSILMLQETKSFVRGHNQLGDGYTRR